MAVNNSAAANRIFQEFSTENIRALSGAMRVWRSFAMEIPSSSRSTLHGWLAATSAFVREWKDSRVLNEMQTLTWEVVNRKWELSWRFNEDQIRDDLSGLVALALQEARGMADKWAEHEDSLVATTVQNGKSKVCYDGQNYFSSSHPTDPTGLNSGTYSNLFTSKPLNYANLITMLQTIRGYKLADGSPWVGPNTKIRLLVDATNVEVAEQLVKTQWTTPAATYGAVNNTGPSQNIMQGKVEPIYNGWFNNEAGVWYLAAENAGVRPIMFQRRQEVETQEMGPGTQLYFDRKEYAIGQDARYEASYTHPQLMIRVEPS